MSTVAFNKMRFNQAVVIAAYCPLEVLIKCVVVGFRSHPESSSVVVCWGKP